MLRRSGSCCWSNDCREQSLARGDRDLDFDELREGAALAVGLRPRDFVALDDDLALLGLALDFVASAFSARRAERRRGWFDIMMAIVRCRNIMRRLHGCQRGGRIAHRRRGHGRFTQKIMMAFDWWAEK